MKVLQARCDKVHPFFEHIFKCQFKTMCQIHPTQGLYFQIKVTGPFFMQVFTEAPPNTNNAILSIMNSTSLSVKTFLIALNMPSAS